jgi:hypothetical protein
MLKMFLQSMIFYFYFGIEDTNLEGRVHAFRISQISHNIHGHVLFL